MKMNKGFKGRIYDEIISKKNVCKISDQAIAALKGHTDFYMEDSNSTYIKVYGSKETPWKLPHYASDQLILMEFSRHLLNVHNKVWVRKASPTYQLPIIIGGYECTTWCQIPLIRRELVLHHFHTEVAMDQYNPNEMIDAFFKKTWKSTFPRVQYRKVQEYSRCCAHSEDPYRVGRRAKTNTTRS